MSDTPLRIVVTVKQVLDPEAPANALALDPDRLVISGRGTPPVLDPYSLHALQAALDLRAAAADPSQVDITVIGVGPGPIRNLYLKALGAGADRALLADASPRPRPTPGGPRPPWPPWWPGPRRPPGDGTWCWSGGGRRTPTPGRSDPRWPTSWMSRW